MVKAKRIERVAALSKLLADHPYRLFSFSYFCKKFAIAKSTLSEDVLAVKSGLELYGLGKVETVSGAAGGVRFIPGHLPEDDAAFLEELAARLTSPGPHPARRYALYYRYSLPSGNRSASG